ncbi:MAG: ribbon-helix-helix domain-containing protein [Chthoniobacteraceae bacterium]
MIDKCGVCGTSQDMTAAKIAITIDPRLLHQLDAMVRSRRFKSRSHAIQSAVAEKIGEMGGNRLSRECAKLDPAEEKAWAELGLAEDSKSWPKY